MFLAIKYLIKPNNFPHQHPETRKLPKTSSMHLKIGMYLTY